MNKIIGLSLGVCGCMIINFMIPDVNFQTTLQLMAGLFLILIGNDIARDN